MNQDEIEKYRQYLLHQVMGARGQHDCRANGSFGPERNTPEQLEFWKGCESGYQAALDELDLRLAAIQDDWYHGCLG